LLVYSKYEQKLGCKKKKHSWSLSISSTQVPLLGPYKTWAKATSPDSAQFALPAY
jgi:hypothetical protein